MTVVKTSDRIDVVRCADCEYYHGDLWAKLQGFPEPIIVAHDCCSKWGDRKVKPDGYCFLGEPRRQEDGRMD